MYSPFTKNHVYTDHSPHQLFGTVSQSYLKCCFLGCSFHSAPNKTELAILTSCLFFFLSPHNHSYRLPMLLVVKKNKTKQKKTHLPMQETDRGLRSDSGRSPGGRAWQLSPVFLPRESHRQKSLVGYSP